VLVNRISRGLALGQRLEILSRKPESIRDTSVNVVALLKINLFEEIAAHLARRNRISVNVRSRQMWNAALNWHESIAKVVVNPGFCPSCHDDFVHVFVFRFHESRAISFSELYVGG
jgi:hypothetical protein